MNKFVVNLLKPLGLEVTETSPVVCMSEEFGFRYHIWIPNMTCQELEVWWRRQHNMGKFYFNPTKIERGQWVTDKSSTFVLSLLGGKYTDEDWNVVNPVMYEIWKRLKLSRQCYYSHYFDDEDSFLETPQGRVITHMGRNPARARTHKWVQETIHGF